ncbi:MAG: hypothetical protein EHM72_00660 [Calditrichaeota bacterium]|nr:MAG: hypothetical protein EHM72_00660 [Calditrichota bacterium]
MAKNPALSMFVWFFVELLYAQESKIDIETLINEEGNREPTAVVEYLEELEEHPLNLNKVTQDQLASIPWIPPATAEDIINYRKQHGLFADVAELKMIRSVVPIYDRIFTFFYVRAAQPPKEVKIEERLRLVLPSAQQESTFSRRIKTYDRVKMSWGSFFSAGALVEKDTGETNPVDLALFSSQISLKALQSRIMLGHFSAETGQGIALGNPNGMSKSVDVIESVIKRRQGLFPYLSTNENLALWGCGISQKIKWFSYSLFAGHNRRDATISNGKVISLRNTGIHQSDSERDARDQLKEGIAGVMMIIQPSASVNIGSSFMRQQYDHDFKNGTGFDMHSLMRRFNRIQSFFFKYSRANHTIFGEFAGNGAEGRAKICGLMSTTLPVEWIILWRSYAPQFQNSYAAGFGDGDMTRNEAGFYMAVRSQLDRRTTLSWYWDQFKAFWPTTLSPMPSRGHDGFLFLQHRYSPRLTVGFRLKLSSKMTALKVQDSFSNDRTKQSRQTTVRGQLQLEYQPSPVLFMRSRIDLSGMSDAAQYHGLSDTLGVMIYQQVRATWKNAVFETRWTTFDAVSFPTRLFQVESDLPGAMQLVTFYGRGIRWYAKLSLLLRKNLRISVKRDHMVYDFTADGGIHSNNVFSLQIDWRCL